MRKNALDAAEWAYERAEADAWRDEVIVDGNYSNVWPRVEAVQISAGRTRRDAQATAERDHAVGLATDHKDWVHAVGAVHVTLASDAKAAADTLAGSLKMASDGLTADQAAAANGLAADLATAEADYASGTATANANHGDAAAGPDGTLEIGLTAVANLLREGIVRERGEYETESYPEHATAIVATSSTALIAPGGEGGLSGPLADLIAYQRAVAQHDLTWSQGAATAKNNFEAALSAEYLAHATAEHGPLGSVPAHIHAAGEAIKNQIIGIANADKALSIASTGNLADFTVDAQSAASKAAKSGVAAEGAYDLARAQAKRDYNNAVADAGLIQTTAVQDADLAYTLATPYPLPENWESTTEAQDLLATRDAAHLAAATIHTNALKTAKITHATTIGTAQITRAEQLRDALITEANEKKTAEDQYWANQKLTENGFEDNVTASTAPGIAGEATADQVHNIVATTHRKNSTDGFYAAYIAYMQAMKPLNVNYASGVMAAEGTYHAATSARKADRYTAWAAGFPTVSQQSFDAAQANAEAQWISGILPEMSAYVGAITTAAADEAIALMQAAATAEAARGAADEAYVQAALPLSAQRTINSGGIWRAHAEAERDRRGTKNITEAAARGQQAIDYAAAAGALGVDYATADKAYWVAWFERGGALVVVPPELPPAIDPLELDKKVAKANADLAQKTSHGASDVTLVAGIAGIVAGDGVYRKGRATDYKNLETQLAIVERDYILTRSGHDQAHALAWLAAQTAQWTAEVNAANARRAAEANAMADLRTADYAQAATAIASIDATLDLPWTQYIADKAAGLSGWWTNSQRGNFLTLPAAVNTAESTYQGAVNVSYAAWVAATAGAESAFLQAQANSEHAERVANATAEEAYEHGLADAEEDWQNGRILNLKNRKVEFWTDRRDAIAANDTTWARTWEGEIMMPDPADAPVDRAFVVADSIVAGDRVVSRQTNRRNRIVAEDAGYLPYIQATAGANRDEIQAENAAATNRLIAIVGAAADHDVWAAQTLSDAIDAVAAASITPWATYDAAVAELMENYTEAVSPASLDLAIALANADKDFVDAKAGAIYTLSVSLSQSGAPYRGQVANARLDHAQGMAQANTAEAQFKPIPPLGVAAPASAAGTGTGAAPTGAPTTPSPDSDQPCGCPLAPRDPSGLPTLVSANSIDLDAIVTAAAAGTHHEAEGTVQLGLPADARKANEDGESSADDFFGRGQIKRPQANSSSAPEGIQVSTSRAGIFPVYLPSTELAISPFINGAFIVGGSTALPPLPDGFEINVGWTDAEIERRAIGLVAGQRQGPLTVAERAQVERWISIIKAHMARAHGERMNHGQRREALERALEDLPSQGPVLALWPYYSTSKPDYSKYTYDQLKATLARHLPPGTDVESWLTLRIQEEHEERIRKWLGPMRLQEQQEKLVLDLIQMALDLGGILDPTPICDGTNTAISIVRLELFDAGVNFVSIIPGVGDLAKGLKLGKWLSTLTALGAVLDPKVARAIKDTLEKSVAYLNKVDISKLPKELADGVEALRKEAAKLLERVKEVLAKAPTGQEHHVISTKIGRAVNRHPTLSGYLGPRDPRFVTQAIEEAAHKGYQKWHRELDDEVVAWLVNPAHKNATPAKFEAWLRWRYSQPDLKARFPNGIDGASP